MSEKTTPFTLIYVLLDSSNGSRVSCIGSSRPALSAAALPATTGPLTVPNPARTALQIIRSVTQGQHARITCSLSASGPMVSRAQLEEKVLAKPLNLGCRGAGQNRWTCWVCWACRRQLRACSSSNQRNETLTAAEAADPRLLVHPA